MRTWAGLVGGERRGRPRGFWISLVIALATMAGTAVHAGSASATMVTVSLSGSGTGAVTSSPVGIDCSNLGGGAPGPACSADFPLLSAVTLTAEPEPSSAFLSWSGDAGGTCAGNVNPCTTDFVLFTPLTATATFSPKPEPPTAVTGAAAEVHFPAATLTGTVNPVSDDFPVTDCHVEYGLTTDYGQSVPCTPGSVGRGTVPVSVQASTGRLTPATVYHYRIVAENIGGIGRGEDRTFTSASAPTDTCPNAQVRAQQGVNALVLPDCMAFEMVSPPGKWQQAADTPSISSTGDRVLFNSRAALGDTGGPLGPLRPDQYVASRTEDGWVTTATSPPAELRFGTDETGHPDSFTPDFGTWISRQGTEFQRLTSLMTIYQASLDGTWVPRSDLLRPLNHFDGPSPLANAEFQAISADGSRLFLRPGRSYAGDDELQDPVYLPGDPRIVPRAVNDANLGDNVYVLRSGTQGGFATELLARDRTGKVWGGTCGAWIGGGKRTTTMGGRNQGAVSRDGRQTYFSTRPAQAQPSASDPSTPLCNLSQPIRILKREETPSGPTISELLPQSPMSGSDFFEGASVDGTKVFFTSSRPLAGTDGDSGGDCGTSSAVLGCDLYLYDSAPPAGQPGLVQVSAGGSGDPSPGMGAKVYGGVTAISGDGSRVYFVAAGVLTTKPNPAGDSAVSGQPNFYLYERDRAHPSGQTSFVGTLASTDGTSSTFGGGKSFYGASFAVPMLGTDGDGHEVGGDGRVLVFRSDASLTPNDTDGGHTDIYRYDTTNGGALLCVSCRPGGPDGEPFDVSVPTNPNASAGQDYAERGRWVSEDGQTIAFSTAEALTGTDVDGTTTSYIWRSGRLFWLPDPARKVVEGGTTLVPTTTVSHDGHEVAFQTAEALLPDDGDSAVDVYVARVDGGFRSAPPKPSCDPIAEACQPPTSIVTRSPLPGSAIFVGPGNVIPRPAPKTPTRALKLWVKKPKTVRDTSTRLTIRVPGKGRVRVSGSGLRRSSKTIKKAGTYRVTVKLSHRSRRKLKRGHRVRVRATVRFVSAAGQRLRRRVNISFRTQTNTTHRSSARSARQVSVLPSNVRKGR